MTYSIIVLMFHRNPELVEMAKDCIASIKNCSKGESYELIIVDNGSTEDETWAQSAADVYVRLSYNKGISAGWNAGLRVASGDYLVVCGDDIIVVDGWLKKLALALRQVNAGVANVHMEKLPHGIGIRENYKWYSGACFMLPREVLETVGYFDERFFPCNWEDADYWTRILGHGYKMYVNYTISLQHREGATLHAKDLSAHFLKNKQNYIHKWGFDCTPLFYGDASFEEYKDQVEKVLKEK